MLPEEDVIVKVSTCQKCSGDVTIATKHMMNRKSKNEFMKEVMENNLSVSEISLIEFRRVNRDWCSC